MKGYIYRYTFPDGKVYIGQTRIPMEMRHAEHINPSTGPNNPGFWDAFQRLGMPNLTVIETIEVDDVEELIDILNAKETYYIRNENATDPRFGYNRMGHAMTYSPSLKILQKEYDRLCQQVAKEKQPFFDSVTRKYMLGLNSLMTEEEQAFVQGYIKSNNPFAGNEEEVHSEDDLPVFDEVYEDYVPPVVDFAFWNYMEETQSIIAQYVSENAAAIIRKAREGMIIQQIDKDGSVIREFLTWDEIREEMNIARIDNILNVVKGRQNSAYGYFWRYKPIEDSAK